MQANRDVDRAGGRVASRNLLRSDLGALYMLLNESRYRALERLLGLRRDQATLATLVLAAALAETTRGRLRRLRIAPPSFAGVAFGSAALRELTFGPPKPGVPTTPVFSGLAVVVIGGTAGIAITKSTGGIRAASRAFVRRYGHRAERARGAIRNRVRQLTTRA
jgi:hypothetical protein